MTQQRKLDLFYPSFLMMDPPPVPPCYIGPALLPVNSRMLVGGCTKVGKSWLVLELARALITASPLFACSDWPVPAPCNVLLLDKELGVNSLLNRWRAVSAGMDHDRAGHRFSAANVRWLAIDQDADSTKILVDAMLQQQTNVLIIDPVNQFTSNSTIDNDMIRRFLDVLDEVQAATASLNSSIIMVHHFKKPPAKMDEYDALTGYNFSGGATWVNAADTIMTVARHKDFPTGREPHGPHGVYWRVNYEVSCRHGEGGGGTRCIEMVPGLAGNVVSEFGQPKLVAKPMATFRNPNAPFDIVRGGRA